MTSASTITTIGYQATTVPAFLAALRKARAELLVDIRAVASSRRAGFSKTALASNLAGAGIDYLHLRGLGTPAAGRSAARAGRFAEMERIYRTHLATRAAQEELAELLELVRSGRRVCLLCFEHDPAHCHRNIVAREITRRVKVPVRHLLPEPDAGHG